MGLSTGVQQWSRRIKTMREKVIRAIWRYPGPLVPLRELQRTIRGATVDTMKIELKHLEQEGFGELKRPFRNVTRVSMYFIKVPIDQLSAEMRKEVIELVGSCDLYSEAFNSVTDKNLGLVQVYHHRHSEPEFVTQWW